MSGMRQGFDAYKGFIRKSGFMEVFRSEVWEATLGVFKWILLKTIIFFVEKAEEKVEKTTKEARS